MQAKRLHLLISAGPTREPLDPVRFLSNYSTGFMGVALARAAIRRGHRVTAVCGPIQERMPRKAHVIAVEQAEQMARVLRREAPRADAVIMAAAVADFAPVQFSTGKLLRTGRRTLKLKPTPDIIGGLPRVPGQIRAGFALETRHILSRARVKLRRKRLDVILAQDAAAGRGPFGRKPLRAWLLARDGKAAALGRLSKPRIAALLLDKVEALCYGQRGSFKSP